MGARFPRALGRYTLLAQLGPIHDVSSSERTCLATGGAAGDRACVIKLLDGPRPGLEAAARLRHETLARVIDVGREGGQAFAVVELHAGRDLTWLQRSGQPLPLGPALLVAREVARGLAAAHAAQVVHGALDATRVVIAPAAVGASVRLLGCGLSPSAPSSESKAEDARALVALCRALLGGRDAGAALATALDAASATASQISDALTRALVPQPGGASGAATALGQLLDAAWPSAERERVEKARLALLRSTSRVAPTPTRVAAATDGRKPLEIVPLGGAPSPAAGVDVDMADETGLATPALRNLAPAGDASVQLGKVIDGRYKLVQVIGQGGMGWVYEAEHVEIGKRLALKILLPQYSNQSDLVARFRREARAATLIGHPNIVDVTDSGTTADGNFYFVMERLEGADLAETLSHEKRLAPDRAVLIVAQVCRALAAAHTAGIIHRDLKPENVFLCSREGQADFVKVLDFGIAKANETHVASETAASRRLTVPGLAMGTPEYMAPEQAAGRAADPRADIYSVGAILYELLTGQPPFAGDDVIALLTKKATEEPKLPSLINPDVPLALEQLVMQALAREPERRPQSMAAFEYELTRITRGRGPAVANMLGLRSDPYLTPPSFDGRKSAPAMAAAPSSGASSVGAKSGSLSVGGKSGLTALSPSERSAVQAVAQGADSMRSAPHPVDKPADRTEFDQPAYAATTIDTPPLRRVPGEVTPLPHRTPFGTSPSSLPAVKAPAPVSLFGVPLPRLPLPIDPRVALGGAAALLVGAVVLVVKLSSSGAPPAVATSVRAPVVAAPAPAPVPVEELQPGPPPKPQLPPAVREAVEPLLEWARRAADAGRFIAPPGDNLKELLDKVAALDPQNATGAALRDRAIGSLMLRGDAALEKGRFDDAVDAYRTLVAFAPDDGARHKLAHALALRARHEIARKHPAPALADAAAATELFADDSEVRLTLGAAALAAGDRERAVTTYRALLAADPANEEAKAGLARAEKPQRPAHSGKHSGRNHR